MDMTLFLEPLSFVSRAFLLIPSFAKGGTLASLFVKGDFLYVISHLAELFVNYFFGNISIIPGIPIASPFCKGGLRGILLMQPEFIEKLLFLATRVCIS